MKLWIRQFLIEDENKEAGYHIYPTSHTCQYDPKYSYDPEGWVFLCEHEIEVPDPEFDVREMVLKGLEGEKKRMMADYSAKMASIEDRISKLTALEVLPDEEA